MILNENTTHSPSSICFLLSIVIPFSCLFIHVLSKLLIWSANLSIIMSVPIYWFFIITIWRLWILNICSFFIISIFCSSLRSINIFVFLKLSFPCNIKTWWTSVLLIHINLVNFTVFNNNPNFTNYIILII